MRSALIGLVALGAGLVACGGDDDDAAGDVDASLADAGPPDAPVATGLTAAGGFAGASALARQEHADATLFEVTSQGIDGSGEVDPGTAVSAWNAVALHFVLLLAAYAILVTNSMGRAALGVALIGAVPVVVIGVLRARGVPLRESVPLLGRFRGV